jgi:predicted regulator of Ras-like GTPase activity (Roadblock/LC7/MglB family)
LPYLKLLEGFLERAPGAHAALLLDAQGEVVVEAGARDDRHRLIGAYHGIALGFAQRSTRRYAAGSIHYIVCRYAWGTVILRPLKDGYYLVVSLSPEASLSCCLHRSAETQERLDAEL